MKKIILFLIFLLLAQIKAFSQNIVVIENDTLVTLEREKVRTLNQISLEREFLVKEIQICDSLGILKDLMLQEKEEEIDNYKSIIEISEFTIDSYDSKIKDLEKSLQKQKTKAGVTLFLGITATFAAIIFL